MGHELPNIIEELNFVLTHPSCNAAVVDKYYHNWLMFYDEVPLFRIVTHIQKENPMLLREWSRINMTVKSLIKDIDPNGGTNDDIGKRLISVQVDLSGMTSNRNGIFRVSWESAIEEPIVTAHFKTNSLHVIDKFEGKLMLVGVSKFSRNQYHLYVKKGRQVK